MRAHYPSVIVPPKTAKYVTQEDFERKVHLQTAKYRRLVCSVLSLLILMILCFAISLSSAHFSRHEESGFSCIYQDQLNWESESRSQNMNMPDNFNLETETFTAKVGGMYHITYSLAEFGNITDARVSLLHNSKPLLEGGRSMALYLKLNEEDTLALECDLEFCDEFLYFCVALIP